MRPRDRPAWIFDMDGTLTRAVHDFEAIRQELELPVGKPILESLANLPADEAVAKRKHLENIEQRLALQAQPQPGVHELLTGLQNRNAAIGVLTRNTEQRAYETLTASGLLDFFDPGHILGRDSCAPKPEPDGIHTLLGKWQIQPQDAVMVGDYVFDLMAGRAAGTATVHLDPSGKFPWPEHTDTQVSSLHELTRLI